MPSLGFTTNLIRREIEGINIAKDPVGGARSAYVRVITIKGAKLLREFGFLYCLIVGHLLSTSWLLTLTTAFVGFFDIFMEDSNQKKSSFGHEGSMIPKLLLLIDRSTI